MEEPNAQSMSSTNVRDDETTSLPTSSTSSIPPIQYLDETQRTAGPHDMTKPFYGPSMPHPYASSATQASSSGNSNMLPYDELNEAVAEPWSAPTQAGNEHEAVEGSLKLVSPCSIANSAAQTSSTIHLYTLVDDNSHEAMPESCSAPTHAGSRCEATERRMLFRLPSHSDSDVYDSSSTLLPTLVDATPNEVFAESWSGPTYAGSIREPATTDLYASNSPEQIVIPEPTPEFDNELYLLLAATKTEPEPLILPKVKSLPAKDMSSTPHGLTSQDLIAKKQGTNINASSFMHQLSRMGTDRSLERYLAEDPSEAPWTIYHLRTSGTICAFCGSTFTSANHRQKLIDHTREFHLTSQGSLAASKGRPILRPKGLPKLSQIATNKTSLILSTTSKSTGEPLVWPAGHPLKLASDLNAIGTKWQDELQTRTNATKRISSTEPIASNGDFAHFRDPKVLQDKILSYVNTSNSPVNQARLNDFFNGLDLVVDELMHRFPKNETIRGIQHALASLGQASNLKFGFQSAGDDQPAAAPTGVKACHISQHADNVPSLGSSAGLNGNDQTGSAHAGSSCNTNGPSSSSTNDFGSNPTVSVHRKKRKLKKRFLACPVSKDDEIHGRHLSCGYKGAPNMSSLKLHLTSRNHRQEVPLFWRLISMRKG